MTKLAIFCHTPAHENREFAALKQTRLDKRIFLSRKKIPDKMTKLRVLLMPFPLEFLDFSTFGPLILTPPQTLPSTAPLPLATMALPASAHRPSDSPPANRPSTAPPNRATAPQTTRRCLRLWPAADSPPAAADDRSTPPSTASVRICDNQPFDHRVGIFIFRRKHHDNPAMLLLLRHAPRRFRTIENDNRPW